MDENTWSRILETRSADGRAMIFPYTAAVSAAIATVVFGDLGDGRMQLALSAFIVLGSLWVVLWWDGIFRDMMALQKSMPEGIARTSYGANHAKAPIAAFRVVNLVVVALIGVAVIRAIYS